MDKMDFNIAETRQSLMNSLISSTDGIVSNLYYRWKDEKSYEDFSEYKTIISDSFLKILPKNSSVVSITKTFVITLNIPGFPYQPIVRRKARTYEWSSN